MDVSLVDTHVHGGCRRERSRRSGNDACGSHTAIWQALAERDEAWSCVLSLGDDVKCMLPRIAVSGLRHGWRGGRGSILPAGGSTLAPERRTPHPSSPGRGENLRRCFRGRVGQPRRANAPSLVCCVDSLHRCATADLHVEQSHGSRVNIDRSPAS